MGRPQRISKGGIVYHALNRANGRLRIFKKQQDFEAFEAILADGVERYAMRLCGYCIMGNHWHLVLWPRADGDLTAFMRWVTVTHTQRWHAAHGTSGTGHVYQGRFKSFPVQDSWRYLSLMQYVEANPRRAGMVEQAGQWPWSSLAIRCGREAEMPLDAGPKRLPTDWLELVQAAVETPEQETIEHCIKRGCPYGSQQWIQTTSTELGLESTLRSRGRPRKDS
jgi:putative transposase